MGTAIRQRKLFVAEDWRVLYRAFTEINFAAYDFDTIRDAMVDYVRINFPEDFNDWIESSEFVALIELLAYLGQSLAFRMDLNTRENFLDTAERRQSILRLARMLSYIPSRNFAATGLLKIQQISTTQPIVDSNGTNLANLTVEWNDPNNPDWYEQFILIMNALFSATNTFGNPKKEGTVGGVRTQLYELNNDSSANRVFPYSTIIDGENLTFEVVNIDFTDGEVFFERDPDPEEPLHVVFRTDGQGNDSADTGFFVLFKQGFLRNEDFRINVPIENRLLEVQGTNINDTDVFVQEIDENGFIVNKWEQVPAVIGNNIIFNSLDRQERNIFSVVTRENDQISIRFADGRFANVPTGLFRVWYRESANARYEIKPEDMRGIRIDVPYLDKTTNSEYFISVTSDLETTVNNSSPSESSTSIKERAPQVYHTQDRMVNGEDYNVYPLRNPEAAKLKAVNRIHSGFSRHIDLNDPTGISQDVNLFGEDGMLYVEENNSLSELALPTTLTDNDIAVNIVVPLAQELQRKQFFYFHYPRFEPSTLPLDDAVAGVTGVLDSFYVIGETIIINGETVTLSTGIGTDTADAAFDINAASIPDIVASAPSSSALLIENVNGGNLVLAEGSGTALSDLGFTAGTYTPSVYGTYWKVATNAVNTSSGRLFTDPDTTGPISEGAIQVGSGLSPGVPEYYIQEGSLLRFRDAGIVSVISIFGDGDVILSNGDGAIVLAEDVADGDILLEIFSPFRTQFSESEITQIENQITQKNTFGLRYDKDNLAWSVITGDNLAAINVPFSFENAGDIQGLNLDSSWLLRAEFSTTSWRFTVRGLDYVFESDSEIRFFHSDAEKIVDSQTGRTIIDFIKILKINSAFDTNTTPDQSLSVRAATTSTAELSGYTYTASSDDETLMATPWTGVTAPVFDGVSIGNNDIVLIKNAPDPKGNGVFRYMESPGVFYRHEDADNVSDTEVTNGLVVYIEEGDTLSETDWVLSEPSGDATLGTDDLVFTEAELIDFFETDPVESIGIDVLFNVEDVFVEDDAYVDPRKLKVTFTDTDEDGVPDDPTIFEFVTKLTSNNIEDELPNFELDETELFWEAFTNTDGFMEFRVTTDVKISVNSLSDVPTTPTEAATAPYNLSDGDVIYNRTDGSFHQVNETAGTIDLVNSQYKVRRGRNNLYFQWKHFAPINNRIDPAITNIIDIYVLTTSYDIAFRQWIDDNGADDEMPDPPTSEDLRVLFSEETQNKMISDEVIFHPVRYKTLFGSQANEELQASFKVTKVTGTEVSDGEIKARVINAINEFFAINNWDFGETFYFTELAAFVHQQLASIIGSIVLVPLDAEQHFGDLFQVRSEPNEVFISTAKVSDIQIVDAFSDELLRIGS